MRKCGDCQACCKALPLTTIGKPAGERCRHQSYARGCKIFGQFGRPTSCSVWSCMWLRDPQHPLPRPDRAGYFIDPTPDLVTIGDDVHTGKRVWAIQVCVDRPDLHRDPELRAWLEEATSNAESAVVVRYKAEAIMVLIPPAWGESGAWQEHEIKVMKPATVGEIKKAMVEDRIAKAKAAIEEPKNDG
jgi:hypothetical protein